MKHLLHVTTTKIGSLVEPFLTESTLIIFNDDVPDELHDIAILHTKAELSEPVQVSDLLIIGDKSYSVTAVGDVTNNTLASMGHCTIKFDGATTPELPGTIHVENNELFTPAIDMTISFVRP
ncbi:PTS glucitol/sorbitol transporter subunit IIA [Brevibacillus daliensis]|uniref:PTS glucitol/sorbitol transporter subunit IIA n=1 Tax=Brevibacillus daliensis TaxID=2892995 RepID=UPI001E3FEB2C|nr:PTS glucitol/sorbitol transporter subunit IIA [Brevibacillus daliensis]